MKKLSLDLLETDQSLVYKVTLPLISKVTWRRDTVIAWPVQIVSHYVSGTLPSSVLFDTGNINLVFEPTFSHIVSVPLIVPVAIQFSSVYELLHFTSVYDSHCYCQNSCPG